MLEAEKLLDIARAEIGTKERPANSNNVKYNTWYYGIAVSGSAYPWCMAFVQWCYDKAGYPLPIKTASCGSLLRWYKANDPECVVKEPEPGCLAIFDFTGKKTATDHIGIVEGAGKLTITTIDGNTGTTSEATGGCVMRRTRNKKYVTAYIKPRCLWEDEDMDVSKLTNEDCYEILLKANEYAAGLSVPQWGKDELAEAKAAGITDGTRPLATVTRMQAAIMAKRAVEGKK